MFSVKGKNIVVIGAKRSGLSLCRLIKRQGGRPFLSDRCQETDIPSDDRTWLKKENIQCEFGGHTPEFVGMGDMIVLSPGVPLASAPVQWTEETGQEVYGEIEFASFFCDKPIIAVTGSNGKTTTTTLIHMVLKEAGYSVCVGGNIGTPFSEFADDPSYDCMVLEVSSFQMESVHRGGFHPHIAVFLNFSQNHLDRHADIQEYFDAKTKIFLNQNKDDFAVLNAQDEMIGQIESKVNSCIVYFNQKGSGNNENPNRQAVRCVAGILNIDPAVCQKVFDDFKGVEHRLEFVRSLHGVDYINDSKSTTVEAGRWALDNMQRPVVMICGGSDKKLDYSGLKPLVRNKVKHMIVFGEIRSQLERTFKDDVDVKVAETLDEVLRSAKGLAKEGDVVLFSPMTASFDMFSNYEHRGQVFKELVKGL